MTMADKTRKLLEEHDGTLWMSQTNTLSSRHPHHAPLIVVTNCAPAVGDDLSSTKDFSKSSKKVTNMNCEQLYFDTYHHSSEATAFCPYRISPLGAHIDHQFGKINGLAINRGIHIAYSKKENGVVELQSLNFPKRAQFHINSIPDEKAGDWADHCRGAAKMLAEKYPLRYGLSAVIEGTLPIGGLSSSASVIICFLSALAKVNNIRLGDWETIMMAKAAENKYVGVNCGKLDQSCEVLCKKDQLLYLDCKDDSYTLIPTNPAMKPYSIAIFFSGLERSLASSAYNLRQDECKAAAYNLLAYAGMDYGKFIDTRLRDVPVDVFEAYKDRLPENFRKRATHYFSEIARAEAGAEAWKNGDLDTYGQLVFQSGKSSIENYECGCPELIALYNIMSETDGIYGGRFSGAGFKGCCMALVDPDKAETILHSVGEKYLKEYPALEGKYMSALCSSADGVKL
jgi:galactokinase/galacturonokinase